jgi:hypothetical protein
MRRLSRLMTGVAMLALLAGGCGSTGGAGGDDALVMQFIQWDNTGLTQADAVGESSADVDVIPSLCPPDGTPEPFTQTVINAIFQNNEGSDILLQSYSTQIHFQTTDSQALADLARANITNGALSTSLPGKTCGGTGAQCFVDSDCALGVAGSCQATQTTVSGIVLVDFLGKAVISQYPGVFLQATPVTVTFAGSDPNRSFQITANYQMTFADFDNCMMASGGGAGAL